MEQDVYDDNRRRMEEEATRVASDTNYNSYPSVPIDYTPREYYRSFDDYPIDATSCCVLIAGFICCPCWLAAPFMMCRNKDVSVSTRIKLIASTILGVIATIIVVVIVAIRIFR